MTAVVTLTKHEAAYLKQIAFNRFIDNVEKALRGDKECRDNLLAEDLADIREYVNPVMRQLTGQELEFHLIPK